MPSLSKFKQGTAVYPEDSTTILIQVGAKGFSSSSDKLPVLIGAGINGQINMPINLPDSFEPQWKKPQFLSFGGRTDIYFFSNSKVIGLPRTSNFLAINY